MSTNSNTEKLVAQAQKFVDKGQFDKALREYQKAIADGATDIHLWIRVGDLHVKLGQKSDAAISYKKVALVYTQQSELDKAVAVYKQILSLGPPTGEVLLALADLYRKQSDTAQATRLFEQAAQLLLGEGRVRESLAAEQSVVDLAPENVGRRIKLAERYSKENLFPDAAREFSAAAGSLRRADRMDDYAKVAERLLYHDPQNLETLRELARFYLKRGDAARALSRLQAGFKIDHRAPETLDLLAEAFGALGKSDKQIAVLKELARIYGERGTMAAAVAVYQRLVAIAPDDAEVRNHLSKLGGSDRPAGQLTPAALPATLFNSPSPQLLTSTSGSGALPIGRSSALSLHQQTPASGSPLATAGGMTRSTLFTPPSGSAASAQLTPPAGGPTASDSQQRTPVAGTPAVSALQDEDEASRLLAEADSFLRFGLGKKAVEHLKLALTQDPSLRPVRERLVKLYEVQRQYKSAIAELRELLSQCSDPQEEIRYLRDILRLDNQDQSAQQRLKSITGTHRIDPVSSDDDFDEPEISVSTTDAELRAALGSYQPPSDLAATSEVPLAEFQRYLESMKGRSSVELLPVRSGSASRSRPSQLPDDSGEAAPPPLRPSATTRPNAAEVEAVAEQLALTSGTLKQELDEVDFCLQQRMYDDARRQLQALAGRYPHSKTVQAKIKQLEQPSSDVIIDVDMADVHEELILSNSTAVAMRSSLPPSPVTIAEPIRSTPLLSQTIPPAQNRTIPSLLNRTIPPPLRQTNPPPTTGGNPSLRLTIPPPITPGGVQPSVRTTIPPPIATAAVSPSLRMTIPPPQRGLPPPPPRPSRVMKTISAPAASPSEASGAFRVGLSLRNRGQYDQAISEFEKALGDAKRGARAALMTGLCYRDQNRIKEAIESFKLGIHMPEVGETDLSELFYQLGRSYELLSDAKEALHFYQKALGPDGRFRDSAERIAILQRR